VKLSESQGTGAGHHGPKMKSWCGQLPVPFMNLLLKTLVARIDFAYRNLACTNRWYFWLSRSAPSSKPIPLPPRTWHHGIQTSRASTQVVLNWPFSRKGTNTFAQSNARTHFTPPPPFVCEVVRSFLSIPLYARLHYLGSLG
jgi:hypothetical protein